MADALFWIFSAGAVLGGAGVVLNVRNTINAALSLVATLLALSGLFFLLQAQFVALIQVMIYAGAIVVLFLFVIMLLNLKGGPMGADSQALMKILGGVLIGAATVKLAAVLTAPLHQPWPEIDADYGTTRSIGFALYGDYLLAFEVAGVLLLAGIVAAVVIAKRRID